MNSAIRYCLAGCLTALGLAATAASAAILTFEEFPHEDELQGAGDTISSKGYTLSYMPAEGEPFPIGFFTVGPSWRYNGRSAAMLANSCSAVTTMVADDDTPFTLLAIDLDELNGDGPVSATFVGVTTEGREVRKSFHLNGRAGWQRFLFPLSFRQLRSVSWTQGDCFINKPHMFDNIVVFPTWRGGHDEEHRFFDPE